MSNSLLNSENELNNQQNHLEKAVISALLILKKIDFDLFDYAEELDRDRRASKEDLQRKLKNLLERIHSKSLLLKNDRIGDISDFKQFKKDMVSIQDAIQNLKGEIKLRISQLNKENDELVEDVDHYNSRILEWSEPVRLQIYCRLEPIKIKSTSKRQQYKEVKEFFDFVHASGGHENGWRREDHFLFTKLRKKYKDVQILALKLHEALPDVSVEDIIIHEEWFNKYLTLEMRKKNAINAWKNGKAQVCATVSEQNSGNRSRLLCQVGNREELYQQLMKWKRERQTKMENAREIEMSKLQQKRAEDDLRRKKNDEMKELVREWKEIKNTAQQKEKIDQKQLETQEKKRRAMVANKLIKQFQSQDDLYIAKVKQLKKREELAVPIRSKSSTIAKKDPNRLLRPTQQWINRVHDDTKYSTTFPNMLVSVNKLPKLHIPDWRKKGN